MSTLDRPCRPPRPHGRPLRGAIVGALAALSACISARPQASRDADIRALSALPEVVVTSPTEGPGIMTSDVDVGPTRIWLAVPTVGLSVLLPLVLSNEFERGARLTEQYRLAAPTATVADALVAAAASDTAAHVRWRLVRESEAPETRDSPPTVRVGRGIVWLRHVPFRGRLYRVVYSGGAVVRTGENVAHGSKLFAPFAWIGECSVSVGSAADGMTREKLFANDAALLKQKMAEAERACGAQLGRQFVVALRSVTGDGRGDR